MLKLISQIHYKNTSITKHNSYTWCGVVDKNGRMLKHSLPSSYAEFASHISAASEVASDMLMDHHMYDLGINQHIRRYFKLVSPSLHAVHLAPYGRDRGKYKNERIYLFHNWYDAFYNIEWYFKGALWIFSSLRNLNNYLPFVNDIRIMRCNHDFVEMFGEDAVESYSYDDIISNSYVIKTTSESKLSNQYISAIANSSHKREKKKHNVTILDNGMQMIIPESQDTTIKSTDVPDIYDYKFEIYSYVSHKTNDSNTSSSKVIKKVDYSQSTTNRNNMKLVLR